MASSSVISKVSSRLYTLSLKLQKPPLSISTSNPLVSASSRRISRSLSRLPVELSTVDTMMPLHSATASARLISSLPVGSQSWGLVPQGISMPL